MRRGLLLSGGGFFGAFQAGACEVLGKFDCIVGASAGALNGWAIASGMPPAELQARWLRAATEARHGFHFPRYWGDGVLNTLNLEKMVRSMVQDWRPKVDFGVVVSHGWNCRQSLVRGAAVDAEVILASCAVPFLLPAKTIEGRLTFDGGVRDACPLWAARQMGAEQIIAVNVWTHLPRWWPGHTRRTTRHLQRDTILVEPPRPLGPLLQSATADAATVQSWIALGRETAAAVFARQ